ncbi:MAG: hypothetical protein V3V08_09850 [Nannocystaceae bacterium]
MGGCGEGQLQIRVDDQTGGGRYPDDDGDVVDGVGREERQFAVQRGGHGDGFIVAYTLVYVDGAQPRVSAELRQPVTGLSQCPADPLRVPFEARIPCSLIVIDVPVRQTLEKTAKVVDDMTKVWSHAERQVP